MFRMILSFFGGIFTTLTMSVGMVALTIGAVFWMYGRDLPSHESLAYYTPPTISRIYSGQGKLIDEFATERRLFAPADTIPDLVKQAFISAEDKNFYDHDGYDLRGIGAAAVDAVKSRGRDVRGASTITQQVMKNFLLSGDRQAERKIKEIILAARIEEALDKEKILELYLNEIFLGQNSYGVAAASQTYFNKTLSELAPHEAAFLASLPKAPSDYHPVRRKERLLARRNFVLREMKENGYLTEAAYQQERDMPLRSVQNGDFESFKTELPPRDYFTDEIRRQLSEDFGEGEFFTGGLTVRATIDNEMQPIAADALRRELEALRPRARRLARHRPQTCRPRRWWTRRRGARRWPTCACRATSPWRPSGSLPSCWRSGRSARASGIEGVENGESGNWVAAQGHGVGAQARKADGKPRCARRPGRGGRRGAGAPHGHGRRRLLHPLDAAAGARGAGRLRRDGREHRPRDRHAGRVLLSGERVQPRHAGQAAARLELQALRLCRSARQWLHARDHRGGRAHRDQHAAGRLAAAELLQQLLRADAAAHRDRAVAQPDDHPSRAGGRHERRRRLCRAFRRL